MPKITLNLSPPLSRIEAEATAMGVSFPALLTADMVRYRGMADAALPALTDWQWRVLSEVLDGIEAHRILDRDDSLPTGERIAAEIDAWADRANEADMMRASDLRRIVAAWTPLAVAGVLFRLRGAQTKKPAAS